MKAKVFLTSIVIFFCVLFLSTCDNIATINQVVGGIQGRIVVTSRNGNSRMAASEARNVIPSEDIELYIVLLKYHGDVWRGSEGFAAIGLVQPKAHRPYVGAGTEGSAFEDWFGVGNIKVGYASKANFTVINLWVENMRIGGKNGQVYPFPVEKGQVHFGTTHEQYTINYPGTFEPFYYNGDRTKVITTTIDINLTDEIIDEYWERSGDQWVIKSGKDPYDLIMLTGSLD